MRALWGDRRGAISILTALVAMAMIGFAAMGIDVGMLTLSQRRLQGVADQAALAAASSAPERRGEAVRQIVAAAGLANVTSTITPGSYRADASIAPASRFASGADAGALRIVLRQDVPLFFGRVLTGRNSSAVAASAVSRRIDLAAFSLGTRLLAVQGGLPGAVLNGLAGSDLSLSLMDYQALVGGRVDLLRMTQSLGTRIGLTGASFDTILATDVTLPTLLTAMADATGNAGVATLLRNLSLRVPGSRVPLTRLIALGPLGGLTQAPSRAPIVIDAYSMLRESLSIANGQRQVALDLGASVPGLLSTKVLLAIGERPANSPWLAVAQDGGTVVRTAQQRLLIDTQIGVPLLANIQLPIFVETAAAQARLSGISCSGTARTVTIDALPSPGTVAIAQIDRTRFNDMSRSPITGGVALLQVTLVKVMAYARIDLASDGAWQRLTFNAADIDNGTPRTVTSNSALQGIAGSLINKVSLTLEPLSLGLNWVLGAVGAALTPVAPALDGLINSLLDLLGLHVGQADVTMNGVRCGGATLVA
ncbi:pilus assembly protein TadG-related protein [Sphingomonas sp. Leaf21]|uniref:pilus assembly protein TadG-related protein n=1 Tax=Sphingomonas sp. Leaf21 TaxID=2876550 RepID=UPI001E6292D9|nr:pilus assembly protein TadG-related protein [Sphingomonas sp. Leaf21]